MSSELAFADFVAPGGGRARDLTGQTFGKLEAVRPHSRSRNGQFRWVVRCECGTVKDVLATHLVGGKTISCGCHTPVHSERKAWHHHGGISGQFWDQIRRGANGAKGRRVIPFLITIEEAWGLYLEQEGRCALSGIQLELGRRQRDTHTASLDRIDSGGSYEIGNVQWVHKDVNAMKGRLDQAYFIDMCAKITLKEAAELKALAAKQLEPGGSAHLPTVVAKNSDQPKAFPSGD